MKLRLSQKTLRFRLSPDDIATLKIQLPVREELQISPSLTWSYELKGQHSLATTQVKTEDASMQILLPENDFQKWLNSSEIEWEYDQSSPPLHISIEKDLKPHHQ